MKKIKLNSVLETLSEMELKEVKGGGTDDTRMVMPDDMIVVEPPGGGGGGGSDNKPKKPWDGKKLGDSCEFVNLNGYLKYGICEAWVTGGLVCVARDYQTLG
jgi:hypothetical protein